MRRAVDTGPIPGLLKLPTMQWNQGREANRQFDSNEANEANKT